jgi:hypothetical protein
VTLNDLKDLKKHAVVLLLRNLPRDAREEHLSAFLWQRLGISVAPEQLSIKPLEPPFDSANCLAVITHVSLADFFSRALDGIAFDGRQLQVHKPMPRTSPTEGREDER